MGEKKIAVERQVIVNWYTPEERIPNDGDFVVATVSGKCRNIIWDHALVIAEYYADEGWFFDEYDPGLKGSHATIHAWADLEPYEG